MKEHILRELVNDLRDISIRHHDKQCLRELIRDRVCEAVTENNHWHDGAPIRLGAVAEIKRSVEKIFRKS